MYHYDDVWEMYGKLENQEFALSASINFMS